MIALSGVVRRLSVMKNGTLSLALNGKSIEPNIRIDSAAYLRSAQGADAYKIKQKLHNVLGTRVVCEIPLSLITTATATSK